MWGKEFGSVERVSALIGEHGMYFYVSRGGNVCFPIEKRMFPQAETYVFRKRNVENERADGGICNWIVDYIKYGPSKLFYPLTSLNLIILKKSLDGVLFTRKILKICRTSLSICSVSFHVEW